jgi:hypothetical protein
MGCGHIRSACLPACLPACRPFAGTPETAPAAAQVLGYQMHKSKKVTMSNWEDRVLSKGQVKYAALDALVTGMLYRCGPPTPPPASQRCTGRLRDQRALPARGRALHPEHLSLGPHSASLLWGVALVPSEFGQ